MLIHPRSCARVFIVSRVTALKKIPPPPEALLNSSIILLSLIRNSLSVRRLVIPVPQEAWADGQ